MFIKNSFWAVKYIYNLLIQSLPSFLPCIFFCGNEPRYRRCLPASQSFRGKCWSFRTPTCSAAWPLSQQLLPCLVVPACGRAVTGKNGVRRGSISSGVWVCLLPVQRMWSRVFSVTVWNWDCWRWQKLLVWTVLSIFQLKTLIFTTPWNPPA